MVKGQCGTRTRISVLLLVRLDGLRPGSGLSLLPVYESGAGVVWLLQAEVKTQFKRFSCNYFIVG